MSRGLARPQYRRHWVLAACALAALAAAALNLALGPVRIPLSEVVRILYSALPMNAAPALDALHVDVVLELRGPRVLLGILVGAALAVAGAAFQGLFRNPLADPSLIGISAGAATGAVTYIVLGGRLGDNISKIYGLPLAATLGALLASVSLYALARRAGGMQIATLLLAGIAINAVCSAISGLMIFSGDEQQIRELTFWSLGSLARSHWPTLLPAIPWMLVAIGGLLALAGPVNALTLGEAEAAYLGYRVERLKALIVLFTAIAVGAAVALGGVIAFVGLIVPHCLRLVLGADNRYVFIGSALAGAVLLLSADLLARTVVAPAELPIGVLTSLIGGPFFLWLMQRRAAAAVS